MGDDEVAELIAEFDANGDGEIDFAEFCIMVDRREKAAVLRDAFGVCAVHPVHVYVYGYVYVYVSGCARARAGRLTPACVVGLGGDLLCTTVACFGGFGEGFGRDFHVSVVGP